MHKVFANSVQFFLSFFFAIYRSDNERFIVWRFMRLIYVTIVCARELVEMSIFKIPAVPSVDRALPYYPWQSWLGTSCRSVLHHCAINKTIL